MKFPVFDLHCDTAFALLGEDCGQRNPLYQNMGHTDLKRAAALPGYTQCYACFTCPKEMLPASIEPERLFQQEYTHILAEVEKNSHRMRLAKSGSDIRSNARNGFMSAILTIEGTAGFGYDSGRLEELYQKGFRMTTLGWNEGNCLAGSHLSGGGLTQQGRAYVKKA